MSPLVPSPLRHVPNGLALASLAAVLLALVSLPTATAHACTCLGHSHRSAVRAHAVAFRGEVVSVRQAGATHRVARFRVLERWKRARRPFLDVRFPDPSAPGAHQLCGAPVFVAGESYRVYAGPAEGARGLLEVGACNPSRSARPRPMLELRR